MGGEEVKRQVARFSMEKGERKRGGERGRQSGGGWKMREKDRESEWKREIQWGHVAFHEISNHTTRTPCRPLNIVYCVTEY